MPDEIRQVSEATLSPTNCIRCHSHVGPFADIDVDVWEGQLYLCKLCADGVTRAMGGCSAEEKAQLEALLSDEREKSEALRGKIVDAKREVISEMLAFSKEIVA